MSPLRYVVLHHDGIPDPHYDLMLELEPGGALATWRCPEWPLRSLTHVERLPDHRSAYLDYEGEISGGRGFVRRVDAGTYEKREVDEQPGNRRVIEIEFTDAAHHGGIRIRRWTVAGGQERWDAAAM